MSAYDRPSEVCLRAFVDRVDVGRWTVGRGGRWTYGGRWTGDSFAAQSMRTHCIPYVGAAYGKYCIVGTLEVCTFALVV